MRVAIDSPKDNYRSKRGLSNVGNESFDDNTQSDKVSLWGVKPVHCIVATTGCIDKI